MSRLENISFRDRRRVMTYDQIVSDIKKKNFSPIYLLGGEEDYFIDSVSNLLEATVLDEAQKSFDLRVLYGRDIDVLTLISEAKRFPFTAEHQLVIVKEAQQLKQIDKLASYISQPNPSTILVLCYMHKKVDKRTKLYTAIKGNGVFLEANRLYENQVEGWVKEYLKKRGFKIEFKALQMLIEKTGTELSILVNELDKLQMNAGEDKNITAALVEEYVGILKDFNLFELQNALIKKDAFKAQKIVRHFAANQKSHPLQVSLSFLFGFVSKVIVCHGLESKDPASIAKALRVNPYFSKDYIAAMSSYNLKRCVSILSFLREADTKSKGIENASISDDDLLKELVFKMLHV